MPKTLHFLLICLILLLTYSAKANYLIEGKINMKGEWQNQIYLATIDRLDDYYSANSEFVINVGPIDNDGNFIIEGDNLPEHAQFYKLFLLKEAQSEFDACLYVGGENHNFVHLILDNNSKVEIQSDATAFAPFGDYKVNGNTENQLMKELRNLVYPSYIFYEIKFPAELKFSQDKLNRDLFNFADTCSSTLVSLAAINNTDFDGYFETNIGAYNSFGDELKSAFKDHPYTKDYFRKLRYYGPEPVANESAIWWKIAIPFLCLLVGGLLWQNSKLKGQLSTLQNTVATQPDSKPDIHLTTQEIKILNLINDGKTNKEIAGDLYIEVSTVKSHINKLYSKLNVKNRQEAIKMAKNHQIQGL